LLLFFFRKRLKLFIKMPKKILKKGLLVFFFQRVEIFELHLD